MTQPAGVTKARPGSTASMERQRLPLSCRDVYTGETYDSFNQAGRMGVLDATTVQVIADDCANSGLRAAHGGWALIGSHWRLVDVHKARKPARTAQVHSAG